MKQTPHPLTWILAVAFLFPSMVNAKDPPKPKPKPMPDKDAPFDGGIGLLIAAGAVYGLKKAYDLRKKCNERLIVK